jgi:hypothetical protein
MKRQLRSFTVVKKGTASEKAELKAMLLRRTVFAQAVTNEAVRAGIQKRGASTGSSA